MTAPAFAQLILLAAIWGASFLFMRISAPVLDAAWLADLRVGFAAIFLMGVALWLKRPLRLRAHWKHYAILGVINSALPFLLYNYAAQTLSASVLSIVNALAPIWGALVVAIWTRQAITPRAALGMLVGVVGVVVLVGLTDLPEGHQGLWALAAAIAAPLCYGIASCYARQAPQVSAFNNAHGSMWLATLALMPLLPLNPPSTLPSTEVMGAILALGVLCSGVAYLMYFRLIAIAGPASALTVTFLIPLFGMLWGHTFLDEPVGWHTVAGGILVICGTMLVTGFSPSALFGRKRTQVATDRA
ncbi:MAG: DMT family transporter [Gammaproteobacteria bacterium]|nr:MAG: DMT family transporter [Gammaproteobacteria bacterium]